MYFPSVGISWKLETIKRARPPLDVLRCYSRSIQYYGFFSSQLLSVRRLGEEGVNAELYNGSGAY